MQNSNSLFFLILRHFEKCIIMQHSEGPTFLYFIAKYWIVLLLFNNIQKYQVPFVFSLLKSKINNKSAMARAVSHRPLKAKATVRSKANIFAVAGEQSGNGTVYLWLHRISRVSVLPPMLDTQFIYHWRCIALSIYSIDIQGGPKVSIQYIVYSSVPSFTKPVKKNSRYTVYVRLVVACWPLVPKFAGSNPAEAVGFLRAKKSSALLHSEGKQSRLSHVAYLRHVKDP